VIEGGLQTAVAAFLGSLGDGDAAGAARAYSPDAALVAPTAELIRGRGEIEDYWHTGIALGLCRLTFDDEALRALGAVVVESGRYAVTVDAPDGDITDRGTYLVLHRLGGDGLWRRSIDVLHPDEPSLARRDPQREESR
jgi:ketosteroid isomerase-like protein